MITCMADGAAEPPCHKSWCFGVCMHLVYVCFWCMHALQLQDGLADGSPERLLRAIVNTCVDSYEPPTQPPKCLPVLLGAPGAWTHDTVKGCDPGAPSEPVIMFALMLHRLFAKL